MRGVPCCSHAAACYEGLNGEVRLSRKPLQVQFCEDSREVAGRWVCPPTASLALRARYDAKCDSRNSNLRCKRRPGCPGRLHVWVCLQSRGEEKMDALLQSLRKDGVPQPKSVQRVGGSTPGASLLSH